MDNEIKDFVVVPTFKTRPWRVVSILLILVGGVSFGIGVSGPYAQRAWQVYLVNFLFWSGLSSGAILFVAVLNMTSARWGRPLKRLAEALGAFMPVAFLLFWLLYFGRNEIFPWIHEPVPGKEKWLTTGFLFARDGVGLFLLTAVGTALLYYSVKKDTRRISSHLTSGDVPSSGINERSGSVRGIDRDRHWRRQLVLSPILGILYALVLTLLSFDLVMSLDPHWVSTLFGGYFFVGSFYTALASLSVLAGLSWKTAGAGKVLRFRHFHDLGKLLLGFCLMTGYLFYSQFLVIWYANIPEETRYILRRLRQNPWEPLAWVILAVCFVLPFLTLLSRKTKMRPVPMMALSGLILLGMWLERFLLVAPSLSHSEEIPLGLMELLITAGFLGAMALTVIVFLNRFGLFSLSDPLFQEEVKRILEETKEASHGN